MIIICIYYSSIVKTVVAHEAALKVYDKTSIIFFDKFVFFFVSLRIFTNRFSQQAQAKKMNVDSLRSAGKDDEESAEVKIAKVAVTNVMLWSVGDNNTCLIVN